MSSGTLLACREEEEVVNFIGLTDIVIRISWSSSIVHLVSLSLPGCIFVDSCFFLSVREPETFNTRSATTDMAVDRVRIKLLPPDFIPSGFLGDKAATVPNMTEFSFSFCCSDMLLSICDTATIDVRRRTPPLRWCVLLAVVMFIEEVVVGVEEEVVAEEREIWATDFLAELRNMRLLPVLPLLAPLAALPL